jgi:hypothetical protein
VFVLLRTKCALWIFPKVATFGDARAPLLPIVRAVPKARQTVIPIDSLIEATENPRFMRAMNEAGMPSGQTASQA